MHNMIYLELSIIMEMLDLAIIQHMLLMRIKMIGLNLMIV